MEKRAVILAGGKGTRLRPYTINMPKPLVPIGDVPIIEIIIRQLVAFGFNHITITVNHMADMIREFCGNGSQWGVKIDYSLEKKPLSTMGPLKLIEDLPDNFLVMNGDVLTNLNFATFFDEHIQKGSIFTISSYERDHKVDYGVLEVNKDNLLTGFQEKPILHYLVSMGVYMVNRKCLEVIPYDMFYGFDDLMLDLIKQKTPGTVRRFNGYWKDIGRPEDYEQVCVDVKNKLINY
ncbi:MAG TPA: sugar phosphate nucleotidyltransferase [Paludibacteraceae bacterium]|jgi:NDP-sugar pyrophosphorylase family protein|nr:sugar phosphate nucleotidyltransferase [Paludibacteraceae bacterium]HOS36747.1 sugar phosphate nucleotidyltransferase [Paludibacteraceae bacterium]